MEAYSHAYEWSNLYRRVYTLAIETMSKQTNNGKIAPGCLKCGNKSLSLRHIVPQSGMRRILFIFFALVLLPLRVSAQLLQPVYSAPSPQAASLGEYGEVPVSHFTGTPGVSVPLFEIEAGDYKYPVGLSYHLGSVKPHAQPGPVGFGWMLTDACISRTVRGVYDEKMDREGVAHGYYGHYAKMHGITDAEFDGYTQNNLVAETTQTPWFELSADEFSFSMNGHSGLFYLNPEGSWTVISDEDIAVEFDPQTGFLGWQDINTRFWDKVEHWAGRSENARWFKGFTLITPDGTRYEFGGLDATDFCVPYYGRSTGDLIATAWHLSKITTPQGRVITLDYSTDQILCDLHYATGRTTTYGLQATSGSALHQDIRGRAGLSGFLLFPAALTQINGPAGTLDITYRQNDSYNSAFRDRYPDALYWEDWRIRSENLYHYDDSDPRISFFDFLPVSDTGNMRENQRAIAGCFRHDLVHRISFSPRYGGTGRSWYFSLDGARPLLDALYCREGVPELEYDWIEGGGIMHPRLRIPEDTSSTSLPQWHFDYCGGKLMPGNFLFPSTDAWGTWDGGEIVLSRLYFPRSESPALLQYARVNALKEIYYPTGGRVTFEYERNEFGKAERPDHTGVIADTTGFTGGLRVKSVTRTDRSGMVHGVTRYHYVDGLDSGRSSGIAQTLPARVMTYELDSSTMMDVESSEGFPAVSTNRNTPTVGYSSVTEETLDGAGNTLGYVRYRYSNFDADYFGVQHPDEPFFYSYNCGSGLVGIPYTSNSTERGKLQSREWYDAGKNLVRRETTRYARINDGTMTVADQRMVYLSKDPYFPLTANMGWLSRVRTYSYLPVETVSTDYTSGGVSTQSSTTAYNSLKLPSVTTVSRSDGTTSQKTYTYSGNSPLYGWMAARHIMNAPVSITTTVEDQSRTEEAFYAQATNALGVQVPYVERVVTSRPGSDDPKTAYEVLSVDQWANPLEIRVDGMRSRLEWNFDGQRLQAVADNVPATPSLRQAPIHHLFRAQAEYAVVPGPFNGVLKQVFFYDENLRPALISGCNYLAEFYSYDAMDRLMKTDEADGADGWGEHRVLETATCLYPTPVFASSEGYYFSGMIGGDEDDWHYSPVDPEESEQDAPLRDIDLVTGYVSTLGLEYLSDDYHLHHPSNRGILNVQDTVQVCFRLSDFSYYHDMGDSLSLDAALLDISLFQNSVSGDTLVTVLPLCVDSQTLAPYVWPDPSDTTGVELTLPPGQYEVVFGGIECVSLDEPGGEELLRGNPVPEDPGTPDPDDPGLEGVMNYPHFYLRMECLPLIEPEPEPEPEPQVISDWGHVIRKASRDGTETSISQTDEWYDDFGRKEVTVAVGANPSGYDLLSMVERDGWGRDSVAWLPSVSGVSFDGHPGTDNVRTLALSTYGSGEKPWSLTEYERSPLSRVTGQYGPGAAWHDNGRKVSTEYSTNALTGSERSCRLFHCTASAGVTSWTVTSAGFYAAGTLLVTRTTDEDGRESLEFKDFDGNTVLSRTKLSEGQYLDTYYVYDGFGNLQAVLPPLASAAFSGRSVPQDALRKYAFMYTYDDRDRCIVKKLPGAEPVYYVYDEADRAILTQDGNARAKGEALFTLYDVFGRVALTGTCRNSFVPGSRIRTVTKATYTGAAGSLKGYELTGLNLSSPTVLTASWYDTHAFVGDVLGETFSASDTTLLYGTPVAVSSGLQTGSWSAVLGNADGIAANGLWSVIRYDRRNRVAKTVSTDHDGGRTVEDVAYTFRGSPLQRHIVHTDAQGRSFTEDNVFTYDHEERLLTQTHSLDGSDPVALVSNSYDPLGRLSANIRGGDMQYATQYRYNIRSWTTDISSCYFKESLCYNIPRPGSGTTAQWGGNISSMTRDDGASYDYAYDGLSRLRTASHSGSASLSREYTYDAHGNITQLTEGQTPHAYAYSGNHLSSAQYDTNGNTVSDPGTGMTSVRYNLLNLPEEVLKANGDTVRYAYSASGAKLRETVIPASGPSVRTDYVGNLVYRDGLLGRILVDGGAIAAKDSILTPGYEFAYSDHLGSVRALAHPGDTSYRKTEYGPYGEVLSEGMTSEYLRLIDPDDEPVDSEEDEVNRIITPGTHLQRTPSLPSRLSGGASPATLVTQVVLPAGIITTTLPNPYRFGGKERLDEGGLDLYDFGARHYTPALPRWMTMDPLAEKYYGVSPYVYCAGNPVNLVDPEGEFPETLWDLASLALGAKSLVSNIKERNVGAAIVDGIGIVADAAAVALPFVPGGVGATIKALRGADKAIDAVTTANMADNIADAGKGLKNANAIKEGRYFEKMDLSLTKASGAEVSDQIRLVPNNGKGNTKGNRTTVDQLIKKDNGHYDVIESKLQEGTSGLSRGQKAAKEHVNKGNGHFTVRTQKDNYMIEQQIVVDNYYIHYKYLKNK